MTIKGDQVIKGVGVTYREVLGCSPYTITSSIEYGGFVDVAGADEAVAEARQILSRTIRTEVPR